MAGISIPEPSTNLSMAEACDAAREAVKLPPIDREWHKRWGRRLDCEPCPAKPQCRSYTEKVGKA